MGTKNWLPEMLIIFLSGPLSQTKKTSEVCVKGNRTACLKRISKETLFRRLKKTMEECMHHSEPRADRYKALAF